MKKQRLKATKCTWKLIIPILRLQYFNVHCKLASKCIFTIFLSRLNHGYQISNNVNNLCIKFNTKFVHLNNAFGPWCTKLNNIDPHCLLFLLWQLWFYLKLTQACVVKRQTNIEQAGILFYTFISHFNSNLRLVIGLKTSKKVKVELPIQSLLTSNTKLMRKWHFCLLLREHKGGHNTLFGPVVIVTTLSLDVLYGWFNVKSHFGETCWPTRIKIC